MRKKLFSLALATILVISAVGCGDNNGSSADSGDSKVDAAEASDEAISQTGNKDEQNESSAYSPKQEMLDAALDSGLVQIGDELFRNGGYMTVNDFMEEYGDVYEIEDTERNDLSADFPSDWVRRIIMVNKDDPEIEIEVKFGYSPDSSRILSEAVVMQVLPSSDYAGKYTWYPWKFEKENIAADLKNGNTITYFEQNGIEQVDHAKLMGDEEYIDYTDVENGTKTLTKDQSSSFIKIGYTAQVMKTLANKYGVSGWHYDKESFSSYIIQRDLHGDTSPYTEKPIITYLAHITLEETNLYGEQPILGLFILQDGVNDTTSVSISRLYCSDNEIIA